MASCCWYQGMIAPPSVVRCMTVKKSDRVLLNPPGNRGAAFYRVNKVQLDAGVLVYQSEAQCFDINSNTIDFKVQRDTQYDLPAPSVRLKYVSSLSPLTSCGLEMNVSLLSFSVFMANTFTAGGSMASWLVLSQS